MDDKDQIEDYSQYTFKGLVGRFIKNSSTYGAFHFIGQFGNFFIIPIYWTFLTPADYGVLGLTMVVQGILTPVSVMGLHTSVERFYLEWNDKERKQKIGKLWCLSVLVALVIVITIEVFQPYFFHVLFKKIPFHPYFRIAIWTVFFNSFRFFPFSILRITEKVKFFGTISLFTFFTNALIIIFMLAVLKLGVLGFLLGNLVNGAFWMIFWIVWLFRQLSFKFIGVSLKKEILYALPALPINFIDSIGRNFDRYLLEKYLSLSQLGFYSLGNRFGSYFDKINASMKKAWFPMTYKMKAQRNDLKKVLPSLSLLYFFIMSIFALAASLLLKEVIYLFGKTKFIHTYQYVPLFILLYLIKSFASAWGRGMDLALKPHYALISTISGVAVGLGLLVILVPPYGTYGALIAIIAAALIRTSIFVMLAHYFYPRKFLFKEVFALLVLGGAAFYFGYQFKISSLMVSGLAKMALVALYSFVGLFVVFGPRRVFVQMKSMKARFTKRGN